jgi:hypothetical protein
VKIDRDGDRSCASGPNNLWPLSFNSEIISKTLWELKSSRHYLRPTINSEFAMQVHILDRALDKVLHLAAIINIIGIGDNLSKTRCARRQYCAVQGHLPTNANLNLLDSANHESATASV